MDRIVVEGGKRLEGDVRVSGSKNSTLSLMAAALLARGESVLKNVPRVRDVDAMIQLLSALGVQARWDDQEPNTVRICADTVATPEAPYELVRKMRASFMVLGPLVARFGCGRVSEPGGCAIGVRPVDQHLKGIEALGAKIRLDHGTIEAFGARLNGCRITFDLVTVNGTQNVMMAATLAAGETVLENAAREPEVMELAEVLNRMGAQVSGAGSDRIVIQGTTSGALRAVTHSVSGDRIEAGTLLAAGMITKGDVNVTGIDPASMEPMLEKMRETGAEFWTTNDSIRVRSDLPPEPVRVVTAPYPGFPTDMQAQLMAVLSVGSGSSVVTETVFENRFMHVQELVRMGADISLDGRSAHVRGVSALEGAQVMATDLRASASLLVAGLAAGGQTVVNRVYHIDRGYERIEAKLQSLGAQIHREG
jgi:UDP-N-acetylglucosamine 1-carboxyvinyltransferase